MFFYGVLSILLISIMSAQSTVAGKPGLSVQSVSLQLQITFLYLLYSADHLTEQCLSNVSFAHKCFVLSTG